MAGPQCRRVRPLMPQVSQQHQDDHDNQENSQVRIFFDRLFVVMINAVGGANAASNA